PDRLELSAPSRAPRRAAYSSSVCADSRRHPRPASAGNNPTTKHTPPATEQSRVQWLQWPRASTANPDPATLIPETVTHYLSLWLYPMQESVENRPTRPGHPGKTAVTSMPSCDLQNPPQMG